MVDKFLMDLQALETIAKRIENDAIWIEEEVTLLKESIHKQEMLWLVQLH